MAKSVAMNSFLLLIASTLIGAYVLDFFGVSIPAVQVAGGIVSLRHRLVAAEQSQFAVSDGAEQVTNSNPGRSPISVLSTL